MPVGFLVATLIAALLVSVIAWLVGRVLMRLSGHFVAVATLGFLVIVRVAAVQRRQRSPAVRGRSRTSRRTRTCGGRGRGSLLVVYVVWRIKRSSYGRDMFAQRDDRVAAQVVGIRVMEPRLLAFVVGAFFSAVAGSLYAHFITSFSPTVFYFDLTFRVITMLVIGGMGSVSGSILGAILIVGLAEALRRVEDTTLLYGLSQIVLAVIFIVVITVRREGLLGQREVPLDRLFDAREAGDTIGARDTGSPDRSRDARLIASQGVHALGVAPQHAFRPIQRDALVDRAIGDVLVKHATERAPAKPRTDPVQLRDERRIGAEQQLAGWREAEQLASRSLWPRPPRTGSPRPYRRRRSGTSRRGRPVSGRTGSPCAGARSARRGSGQRTGSGAPQDRPA